MKLSTLSLLGCLFAATLTSGHAWAQEADTSQAICVKGVVSDSGGSHLSNVSIRVNDYYFVTTTTDSEGSFSLTIDPSAVSQALNKPVDTSELRVTANLDGYFPQTRKLAYTPGAHLNEVFSLERQSVTSSSVTFEKSDLSEDDGTVLTTPVAESTLTTTETTTAEVTPSVQ